MQIHKTEVLRLSENTMYNGYETNERLIDDKIKRAPTGRYHMLVTYLPREEIERVLEHWRDRIDSALYIFHDRDKKTCENNMGVLLKQSDVSSNDNHETDELKPAHWHVLIKLFGNTTESAVRKYFYRFRVTENKVIDGVEKEVLITTTNALVDSVGSARDYLTHENDPDKFRYSKSEVYTFGRGWEAFQGAYRATDSAMEIVDRIMHNTSLRRMVKDYGKDFVFHYKAYKEMSIAIYDQELRAQQYVDLAEIAYKRTSDVIIDCDDDHKSLKVNPRKYNQAVEIVTEFERDFQLYYQGE